MEAQERIRILELAAELVKSRMPGLSGGANEASIEAWHKLFDQAYKAILKTMSEP